MFTILKKEAETILKDLGLNMSTAINIFLRQVIKKKSIPFSLDSKIPNIETAKAIKEAFQVAEDNNSASYNKMSDVYKDLDL